VSYRSLLHLVTRWRVTTQKIENDLVCVTSRSALHRTREVLSEPFEAADVT
jgi:hypothetical protein